MTTVTNTEKLAKAFADWEREWRENPAAFMQTQERINLETSDYGMRCAKALEAYLEKNRPSLTT